MIMDSTALTVLSIENIFEKVTERIASSLEYDRISFTALDQKRFLVAQVKTVEEDVSIKKGDEIPYEGSAAFWCVKTQKGLLNNVAEDSYKENEQLKEANFKSGIHVPIKFESEILGTIDVFSLKANQYGSHDLENLTELSSFFTLLLENFYLASVVDETKQLIENYSNKLSYLLKKIDEQNRKLERFPTKHFDIFDTSIAVVDLKLKIVKVNKNFLKTFDISEIELDDYISKSIVDLFSIENSQSIANTLHKIIYDNEPVKDLKVKIVTGKEKEETVLVSSHIIKDEENNKIGLVVVFKHLDEESEKDVLDSSDLIHKQMILDKLKLPSEKIYEQVQDMKNIPFNSVDQEYYTNQINTMHEQVREVLKVINDLSKVPTPKRRIPEELMKLPRPELVTRVPKEEPEPQDFPPQMVEPDTSRKPTGIQPGYNDVKQREYLPSTPSQPQYQPPQPEVQPQPMLEPQSFTQPQVQQQQPQPTPQPQVQQQQPKPKQKKAPGLLGSKSHEIPSDVAGSVLIIDDNVNTSNMLREFLTDKGFHVLTANDGVQGLIKARDYLPDLILLDLAIPKVNSLLIVKNLQKFSSKKRIKSIMLSPINKISDIVQARNLGANDYVMKPINTLELEQKIFKLLDPNYIVEEIEPSESFDSDYMLDEGIFVVKLKGYMTKNRIRPLFNELEEAINQKSTARKKYLLNIHDLMLESVTPDNLDYLFSYFEDKPNVSPKDVKILLDNQDIMENIKTHPQGKKYEVLNDFINAYSKLQMGI